MKHVFSDPEVFKIVARNKYLWLSTARNLFTVAKYTYRERDSAEKPFNAMLNAMGAIDEDEFPEIPAYIVGRMLFGMAIEVLLKGLILQEHADKIDILGKFNDKFTTHQLNQLITQLGDSQFTKQERSIMEELSNTVIWKGRYPFPDKAIKYSTQMEIKDEEMVFESLYYKLRLQLQKAIEYRPPAASGQ